ncbi:hypothetical protein ACFZCP_35800 [Streptomyces sp. NPDC007971]|uniref:hypothetical protein n=1 Tax=Streptomyces sp. NPDC007971 TaxID=3364799 RepID=UPI0036E3B4F1
MSTLHEAGTASRAPTPDRIDPAVGRQAFTVIVGALAVVLSTTLVTVAVDHHRHPFPRTPGALADGFGTVPLLPGRDRQTH